MFVRIADVTLGQGDADSFFARLQTDVIPIYRAADGFIAYYGVAQVSNAATVVRVFEDEASLDAAVQSADPATSQIEADFLITSSPHVEGDAGVASAFGPV